MKESAFQAKIRTALRSRGCKVYKMQQNATTSYATPDLLFLYGPKYGFLECKRKKPTPSDFQPGQEARVAYFDKMSFARVIYPENFDEVIADIERFIDGNKSR